MTEARRTENLGRELVANASHELRTPLAVIASSAETLMASPDSPARDRREFLEIIARQADRLERLVSDTLHLSQLDSSMPHEALQKMPLQDVVNDVMTALKPAAQQREIRLLNEMGTEDARTEIYPSALRQAVSNLVDNAIRYTQAGGTVAVSIETGDDMTILVRDTGPGIQPADHKRIFERFVRGPQRAAEDVEGSGMGLAIVKRVAEVHGGRIEVESTPEKGSCFKLILPRKAPPDTL